MKLALVHDDLIQFGGAERLLLEMHEMWPDAPVYTSVASKKWQKICKDKKINLKTSFVQKLPAIEKLNRFYSPFLVHTLAFESFNFNEFDIAISVSARYSHGIITKPSTKHICYMNSPGRMFWEPANYFANEPFHPKWLNIFLSYLRLWDYAAAQRVDFFIANSKTPQERIKKYYNRNSIIIYPFTDTTKFIPGNSKNGQYFLIITRLLPWKKVEIAIQACNELKIPLKIVGDGPALETLKKQAMPNIQFLGYVDENKKLELLQNCKAVINTQYEDFGIVPLEAMSCGKPVIAYGKGGVLETIIPGETGELFKEQTSASLKEILSVFDASKYLPIQCQTQAKKFDRLIFRNKLKELVDVVYLKNSLYDLL